VEHMKVGSPTTSSIGAVSPLSCEQLSNRMFLSRPFHLRRHITTTFFLQNSFVTCSTAWRLLFLDVDERSCLLTWTTIKGKTKKMGSRIDILKEKSLRCKNKNKKSGVLEKVFVPT
jgi:hypothetical protein